MDQREHDVEEDLKSILRIRMDLADKIQSLEQRVEDTVRCTRETAMDTIDAAKNKAMQWMISPTDRLGSFDMLARRPSIIAGGVVGLSLLTLWMTQGRPHRRSGVYPYYPPRAKGADVVPQGKRSGVYPYYPPRAEDTTGMSQGEGSRQRTGESTDLTEDRLVSSNPGPNRRESDEEHMSPLRQQLAEFVHGVKSELTEERVRVQQAALQIARSFARDMVHFAGQSLVSLMNELSAGRRARSRQDQPRGGYSHLTGRSA
jgi:hypothetical protein